MFIQRILIHRGLFIAITFSLCLFVLFALSTFVLYDKHAEESQAYEQISTVVGLLKSDFSSSQMATDVGNVLGSTSNPISQPMINQLRSINDQSNIDQLTTTLSAKLQSLQSSLDKREQLISSANYAWIFIAALFYLLVIYPLLGRVSKETEVQEESSKQAQGILNTVTEGLFLLSTNNEIGVEQSASLKSMFRLERDLEGDFFEFIGNYVPQNTVQIAKDFLELLYGDRVKEKLIQDLNPLNKVEISIARRDGTYENRYLNFKFNRVIENGQLSHLLGSVTDVTREVLLENQLQESKDAQAAQLDLLMTILQVDSTHLAQYLTQCDTTLTSINQTLEAKGHDNAKIRAKLSEIKQSAHRIKGDAAALGLHNFEFKIHEFEDSIVEVEKAKERLVGSDLIPIVTHLKVLFEELQNMRSIVDRVASEISSSGSSAAEVKTQSPLTPSGKIELALHRLADTVAERSNKLVNLTLYGFDDEQIPASIQEVVQSMTVQLIRNSIVHGSLSPDQRIAGRKTDFLNIAASFTKSESDYHLFFRDDGEGFNEKAIVTVALEKNLISQEQAEHISEKDILRLVFTPNFSTASEETMDAGRGEGLATLLKMATEIGGSVNVKHRAAKFCQFKITIPIRSAEHSNTEPQLSEVQQI